MVDFVKLKAAREELNKFIEEHGEKARICQKYIDDRLAKAGKNPHNRMLVLKGLMNGNLAKMAELWAEIGIECKKLKKLEDK